MKRGHSSEAHAATRPPLERMLRIHQAIQSGGYPNAATLAVELEVSSKSIHRDIEFMRDRLELPVAYDPSRFGFHYTSEVNAFPSVQISEGELFALIVAEKALEQYRGTSFERPLISAIKKLQRSLPDTISFNLAEWQQTISFRTSAEQILNLDIFKQVANAASQRKQLRIAYRKPGTDKPEERLVDPYHLGNINGEWFLFAYDHLREDIRTFAPIRIVSLEPTGKTFERPADFSPAKMLHGSFGVLSGKGEHDVVIRFEKAVADYIQEKRWHPSQEIKHLKDGGLELRLKLSSLNEIQRWVLGWGGSAKVIAPTELKESVRAAAQAILKQ
jgi:proteasome accessory factor B